MESIWRGVESALGLNATSVSVINAMLRAVVVYVAALIMVRMGEKRFLGKNTAVDVIIGVTLGTTVSSAITDAAAFYPAIAAGFVLVTLHWLLAVLAFRFAGFGKLVKGESLILVENGEILWQAMKKSHVTETDLHGALRRNGSVTNVSDVKVAYLERNGNFSVIKK
jgi:uncharacterized membrane protein YcaP (DUF421 family)